MLINNLGKAQNHSNRSCNFQTRRGEDRNKTIDLIKAEKKVFLNRKKY